MTTFQLPGGENADVADALGLVLAELARTRHEATPYVSDLRSAATVGNGYSGPASMPWGVREHVAAVARGIAADHPEHAERLESLAAGLVGSLEQYRVNGGRV